MQDETLGILQNTVERCKSQDQRTTLTTAEEQWLRDKRIGIPEKEEESDAGNGAEDKGGTHLQDWCLPRGRPLLNQEVFLGAYLPPTQK